ncbi:MAG TPA: orotidine-5'-phosphate decarboxylase [Candidatus Saccharimonadales bacterium]|nr:orotidine-5'-phosphate decarboxylase [Candidatus Saccharimonadales bacterium]
MDFKTKLQNAISKNNSLLCVGLDPDPEKTKAAGIFAFNKKIIDETKDLVCAYKPNIAFYEAAGIEGLEALKATINYIHQNCDIPVLLDAKRADVENTARMYAMAAFDYWKADAVTIIPHLGKNVAEPFLAHGDKMTFMIIKTTANESETIKNAKVGKDPYYLALAKEIKTWPNQENIGIFVGATATKALKEVRAIFPDSIFLTAGLGAQGASTKDAVQAGVDKNGGGILFNASRSIIYAQNPKQAAQEQRDEINKYRS